MKMNTDAMGIKQYVEFAAINAQIISLSARRNAVVKVLVAVSGDPSVELPMRIEEDLLIAQISALTNHIQEEE